MGASDEIGNLQIPVFARTKRRASARCRWTDNVVQNRTEMGATLQKPLGQNHFTRLVEAARLQTLHPFMKDEES